MNKDIQIEEFVKSNLSQLNWHHTKGMRFVGKKLAELEDADFEVVDVAILFHDIAKDSTKNHAKESALLCEKFLVELEFDLSFIGQVKHCVESHSTPWNPEKYKIMPKTMEAKVVFDADMIQQLSPFGIIKHILEFKDENYQEMIKKSMDTLERAYSLLLTRNGKIMGEEKIKKVREFFKKALL